MSIRYTQKLAILARRAARLGMYIDLTTPDPHIPADWEGHGCYVLRDAATGYDVHVAGVSIEFLKHQLDEIEREPDWLRCPTCDAITKLEPDDPEPERKPVLRLVA